MGHRPRLRPTGAVPPGGRDPEGGRAPDGSAGPLATPSPLAEPEPPRRLAALVADGTVEPRLAGLLEALLAAGLPFVVAGPDGSGRETVSAGLAAARRPDQVPPPEPPVRLADPADPEATSVVRRYLAAAGEGLPVAATIDAVDLSDAFDRLARLGIDADARTALGLVVVLGPMGSGRHGVVAAHWVRPLVRDGQGHVQRLGPAVLGVRDPRTGRWDDFAWGVMPELAIRLGRRAGELEAEVAEHEDRLRSAARGHHEAPTGP